MSDKTLLKIGAEIKHAYFEKVLYNCWQKSGRK